jgi:hypothetical protein
MNPGRTPNTDTIAVSLGVATADGCATIQLTMLCTTVPTLFQSRASVSHVSPVCTGTWTNMRGRRPLTRHKHFGFSLDCYCLLQPGLPAAPELSVLCFL